jgi:hypothetical protein
MGVTGQPHDLAALCLRNFAGTQCTGDLVGPRAVLGALERDEPLAPAGNPTSISLNVKPRHYTHYAAPAPKTRRKLCTRVLVFKCVRKIAKSDY